MACLDRLREALATKAPNEWRAIELWLGTFYRFQLEWLLDWSRFSLILKSRQIGCSHTISACAILWGLFGELTSCISIGQREADEVLAKAKLHAKALVKFGSQWARTGGTDNKSELVLASGGRVISLPITSGGRSFTGNIILDELAYYGRHAGVKPDQVWDGAAGTALHGFRLRGLSTPNGVGNFWHLLWSDERQHEGYRLHKTTLDEAIADGMAVDIEDCWKLARGDERVFNQMFRCTFLDGEFQYLPTAVLDACTLPLECIPTKFGYTSTPPRGGRCYAGLDIGHTTDRTELVILWRDDDGMRWMRHAEARKRTEPEDIESLAKIAFSDPWNCRKMCVDQTGLGTFPAEQLAKKYGLSRVENIKFTLQSKDELATGLFDAFTHRKKGWKEGDPIGNIRIPSTDTLLYEELCSLQRVVSDAGNIKYEIPRTVKGHGDRAWALALALRAAGTPHSGAQTIDSRSLGIL